MRFELEIEDATEVTRGSEFGVFGGAEAVRFLRVPAEFPRSTLDELTEFAKQWGAKGLAYIVYGADGEARSPILKFLSEAEQAAFAERARDDGALRRRRLGPDLARARRAAPRAREPARPDRRVEAGLAVGDRLPDVRVGRGRAALRRQAPPVHAAGAGLGRHVRRGSRARDRARLRPDRQRQRARRRVVPDPRGRRAGACLRAAEPDARSSSARSSASCSTRSRWARRRTAASRSGSTAWSMVLARRAEPPRRDRVPEEPGRHRPDVGRADRRRAGAADRARAAARGRSRAACRPRPDPPTARV